MNIATPQEQFASKRMLDAKFRGRLLAPRTVAVSAVRDPIPLDPIAASCPWPCFANEKEYCAKEMSLSKIIDQVCIFYGVSEVDLKSARRTAKVMEPRMVCYYLAKELTINSYPSIGRVLGGRDHTTIITGYRTIVRRMSFDSALAKSVKTIRARLEGGN